MGVKILDRLEITTDRPTHQPTNTTTEGWTDLTRLEPYRILLRVTRETRQKFADLQS